MTASAASWAWCPATWHELTAGLEDPDLWPTRWRRVFASAYIKSHRLKVAVHLRRGAEHPRLPHDGHRGDAPAHDRALHELRVVVPLRRGGARGGRAGEVSGTRGAR